ncbi:hypothetical protein [Pusillimonas sp.]|uniref:hypothetical protein n=1 Tax=Pusillimonas sp. TaxID=3040095 RepID=UPI0037CAE739
MAARITHQQRAGTQGFGIKGKRILLHDYLRFGTQATLPGTEGVTPQRTLSQGEKATGRKRRQARRP